LAFSLSILFIKATLGRLAFSVSLQPISVCTSTPDTAQSTNSTLSATRKAPFTSLKKSAYPGVSIMLILQSFHSQGARLVLTDIFRFISSGK
jgi:hypothetical protein